MASLREDQYKMVFGLLRIYLNLISLQIVQGILLAVDFEKAFLSLNRSFLFKGFGKI